MLSEIENYRFYLIGGLLAFFIALILNSVSFTTVICVAIILGCCIVTLKFTLNKDRQPTFSSGASTGRSRSTGLHGLKKTEATKDTAAGGRYRTRSRSQLVTKAGGVSRGDTMSNRQMDTSADSSRLSRSFGAVRSFLRSPKIGFGVSSPLFSPKVDASFSPGVRPASLPKVHRIRDGFPSGSSAAYGPRPIASAQRRYPTHQPQYSGLGVMPPVNFHKVDRPILSERNTNMIHSPVTVKIAPPDVLKPPVPSLLPVSGTKPSQGPSEVVDQQTCDTANVISAIREKRKRNHRDESVVQSPEPAQESKRRRQADLPNMTREQATQNVAMDTEDTRMKGLKRPAISKAREDSISEMENSAKRSRANSSLTGFTTTSGSRNAIDCSFSSSRRWLEKQVAGEQRVTRSQSREIDSPVKRGRSPAADTPGRKRVTRSASRTRDDNTQMEKIANQADTSRLDTTNVEENFSAANTSTPVRVASSSSAPEAKEMAPTEGDETPQVESVIKKKLFPLQKGSSSKRRQTPIFNPSNANFSKVPSLRYNLTVEDYAEDREADIQRVQQMLQDVDEPDTPKEGVVAGTNGSGKAAVASSSVSSSQGSVSVSTAPATSSALAALLDSTPGVSVTSGLVSTGITSSTNTGTPSQSAQITLTTTTQASSLAALTKSPTSSNLTGVGRDVTISGASVQSPVLATNQPKLPSFSEATNPPKLPSFSEAINNKQTVPTSSSSSSKFTYKPVFATEAPVSSNTSNSSSSAGTAASTAASSVTFGISGAGGGVAAAPTFNFDTTKTTPSSATVPLSTFNFGQGGGAPTYTSGFQFSVEPAKTTASSAPFQFSAAPSTNTLPTLPTYSSAVSNVPATSASSIISFGTSASAAVSLTPSTTSFSFAPSNTGISFGSTAVTSTSTSTGTTASTGTFGIAASNIVPKTTTAGVFTFGAGTSQAPSFGQSAVPSAASVNSISGQAPTKTSTASVFGQTTKQTTPAFGQPAATNATNTSGAVFGTPKQEPALQQSSTFQFGGSTKPQIQQGSSPFTFTANSSKQEATTASSTFSFSASKGSNAFGSGNAFGQSNAPAFGSTPTASSTPFGQQAGSGSNTFGSQSSSQNVFGSSNNPVPFGQKPSGQGVFGQQSTSQNGFGSTASTPFASQSSTQNSFGKSQNVFGASSNISFGTTTAQSEPAKGFDFAAAASGGNKSSSGFNFGSSGGFGTPQTPAGGSTPAFGSPAPSGNPFNQQAPSTPQQNMFSLATGSTAPRPRAVARTARRRTTKR